MTSVRLEPSPEPQRGWGQRTGAWTPATPPGGERAEGTGRGGRGQGGPTVLTPALHTRQLWGVCRRLGRGEGGRKPEEKARGLHCPEAGGEDNTSPGAERAKKKPGVTTRSGNRGNRVAARRPAARPGAAGAPAPRPPPPRGARGLPASTAAEQRLPTPRTAAGVTPGRSSAPLTRTGRRPPSGPPRSPLLSAVSTRG